MKQNYLSCLLLLFCFSTLKAQQHFTPPPARPTPMYQLTYHFGENEAVTMKHHFTIVFADGRDTTVYTKLVADSSAWYLTLENRSVGKKDPARTIKIYPSQTKYISHMDPTTGKDFVGQAHDSCWLFKVITGKMNAYTDLGEISVQDKFVRYLQVDDGPLVAVTDPEAAKLFNDNERALELFVAKDYNRAVKRYNRSTN
jgi:hypothetical protein